MLVQSCVQMAFEYPQGGSYTKYLQYLCQFSVTLEGEKKKKFLDLQNLQCFSLCPGLPAPSLGTTEFLILRRNEINRTGKYVEGKITSWNTHIFKCLLHLQLKYCNEMEYAVSNTSSTFLFLISKIRMSPSSATHSSSLHQSLCCWFYWHFQVP